MPQIGRIDVPDKLWEALVENASKSFTEIAYEIAKDELDLDLSDLSYKPELEVPNPIVLHTGNCVVALVRMQTGDFRSDDSVVEDSDDYKLVLRAAGLQGEQLAYNALSSKKQGEAIKKLLNSNWPTDFVDLFPPF